MRFLSVSVPLLIALFTACAAERSADDLAREQVYSKNPVDRATGPSAADLGRDPLAAGNAEDLETLRIELEEYDARAAQLRDRIGERGLDGDREVRAALVALGEYRDEAESRLGELERRTGESFAVLENDVELMIADLGRNLDATARELEIEVDPVERTVSTPPFADDGDDADVSTPPLAEAGDDADATEIPSRG